MEDRTNEHLVIYDKDNRVIATGEKGAKQVDITDLIPNTDYSDGSYTVAWVKENGDTSDKISVPDFKTLAILMESFTLAPDTITGTEGDDLNVTVTNINPSDVTNNTVSAVSADENIATIKWDDAKHTFSAHLVKAGRTTFNWASADGGAKLTQNVEVTAKPAPAPEPASSQPAESNEPTSATPASPASSPASSVTPASSATPASPASV